MESMTILMSIFALAAVGGFSWRKIMLPLATVLELGDGLAGVRTPGAYPESRSSREIGESLSNLALRTGFSVAPGREPREPAPHAPCALTHRV